MVRSNVVTGAVSADERQVVAAGAAGRYLSLIHIYNVYTHCHCCGEEMRVNLNKVRANTKGTLEHTAMLCKDCTDLLVERMRDS